jgi:hypothetical protein
VIFIAAFPRRLWLAAGAGSSSRLAACQSSACRQLGQMTLATSARRAADDG